MKVQIMEPQQLQDMKALFIDVFSNDPWFDQWTDEQLDAYMADLTGNSNSLSLALMGEDGELIGGSLGYVFNWWEGREYFIREFFVSRQCQNQGAGSRFLKMINGILSEKGIRHIALTTEKDVPAYPFYHKNGFRDLEQSVYLVRKVPE